MVFDDVYPSGVLLSSLEEKYGIRMGVVPFMDCMPNTSYIISEDGMHVFVSIDFGGYSQVKEVKIIPAGKRSKNSKPCFVRRNTKGYRCFSLLSAAVYGAFVSGEMPRFRLKHIDGNPNNIHFENLTIDDDSTISKNLSVLSFIYDKNFGNVVGSLIHFRSISQQEAEDFASDSFLEMCSARIEIDASKAIGLWTFLAKRKIIKHYARNKLVYDIYDALQKVDNDSLNDEIDNIIMLNQLPFDCRQVCQHLLYGYNQREIGVKLGKSQVWVFQQLKKTKAIFQQYEQ